MNLLHRLYRLPLIGWVLEQRFLRFGVVGATGTVVNMAVLFAGQEWLFRAIEPAATRLNFSLPLAVFVATINNFTWNRVWTWRDRRAHVDTHIVLQFGQYAIACWLGIVLQFLLTKLLVMRMHYLIANLIAIVVASVANFLVNDNWTFQRLRIALRKRGQSQFNRNFADSEPSIMGAIHGATKGIVEPGARAPVQKVDQGPFHMDRSSPDPIPSEPADLRSGNIAPARE